MSKSPMTVKLVTQWMVERIATPCGLCFKELEPEDNIQWDHIHAEVFSGPHVYDNLRPVHYACHKAKTRADVQANAKVKRIAKGGRKRRGTALPSKPFPKTKRKIPTRKFNG